MMRLIEVVGVDGWLDGEATTRKERQTIRLSSWSWNVTGGLVVWMTWPTVSQPCRPEWEGVRAR